MKIDINCDVGEGLGNEHLIMPLITSCNISCGAHAGSVEVIDEVIALAKKYKVKIGAHPSYPDRENFGRKILAISNDALKSSFISQLTLFKERCALQSVAIHHVKPHGALYNMAAIDETLAKVVLDAIQEVFGSIRIYAPWNSILAKQAKKHHCELVFEAFADRNYNADGTLVSRSQSNAIITDTEAIVAHVLRMKNGMVITIDGIERKIQAETFCVHGDHPNVIQILEALLNIVV